MKTPTSTIRDVARHAGVSVATISRFLNNASLLAPETAERVKQAMDDLNFTPHPVARNLATRKTNTIGLLLLDIGDNFYTPLLRGIEAVAGDAGYDLLIHTTGTNRGGQPLRRPLSEYNTDGLLVFINALDHRELTRLREIGFPVVLMNQSPPPGAYIPWVTIDNLDGARKIVEHMITVHNRKRIAFLSGPDGNEDSQHREEGYRIALHTHNIPFDPALVGKGNFNYSDAFIATKNMLQTGVRFDAIFTGDDDSAIGVMEALTQSGLSVPRNVAVAGFDDSVFARLATPPLTTVRSPMEEVGRESVAQLIRLIRGEEADRMSVKAVDLIIRQSCGCPGQTT